METDIIPDDDKLGLLLSSGVFIVLWFRLIGQQLEFEYFHVCESVHFSSFSCVLYFKSMCFVMCKKHCVVFCKKCVGEFQTQCKAYVVFAQLALLFSARPPKLEVVILLVFKH